MKTERELIDEVYQRLKRKGFVTGPEDEVKGELLLLVICSPRRQPPLTESQLAMIAGKPRQS